jgi:hypothetical protein
LPLAQPEPSPSSPSTYSIILQFFGGTQQQQLNLEGDLRAGNSFSDRDVQIVSGVGAVL